MRWLPSADLDVSASCERPLLGVDLVIVGRRASELEGRVMSTGVMASAQGLLEVSSSATAFPLLLSLLLSRIVFGSPLTAPALLNPEDVDPELDSGMLALEFALEVILEVSMVRPLLGDLPLPEGSSSTQPAGVGGTGPKVDIGCGLRVGGAVT